MDDLECVRVYVVGILVDRGGWGGFSSVKPITHLSKRMATRRAGGVRGAAAC